jgi:hypothetical protein
MRNLRVIRILLGRSNIDDILNYLSLHMDDAIVLAKRIEILILRLLAAARCRFRTY